MATTHNTTNQTVTTDIFITNNTSNLGAIILGTAHCVSIFNIHSALTVGFNPVIILTDIFIFNIIGRAKPGTLTVLNLYANHYTSLILVSVVLQLVVYM